MLAKGHFVREKQVEIFGVHEWGFCHEALDMTLGLFLTKVEGFVLIQKNYECSKRQQFGLSGQLIRSKNAANLRYKADLSMTINLCL